MTNRMPILTSAVLAAGFTLAAVLPLGHQAKRSTTVVLTAGCTHLGPVANHYIDANALCRHLAGQHLNHFCFARSNLDGAVLTGCDLSHATLADTSLRNTDLTGARLTDADLTGADLTGAVGITPDQEQTQHSGTPT
jgi:uncharacterized protein YjbI with pentapeptide repeats